MKIPFGSPVYFICLSLVLLPVPVLFLILRGRTARTQTRVLFLLALANALQHLGKSLLYPHLWGSGFSILNGAYNLCALLILATPFTLYAKTHAVKSFVFLFGTVAGIATALVPYWFFNQTQPFWEAVRFYLCHGFLLYTSLLPLLLGLHRPIAREWWKTGFLFLLALCVILANDVVFITAGLCPQGGRDTLFATLLYLNPVWLMQPPPHFPFLARLTLPVFAQNGYVPILWYALPAYALAALLTLLACAIFRRNGAK